MNSTILQLTEHLRGQDTRNSAIKATLQSLTSTILENRLAIPPIASTYIPIIKPIRSILNEDIVYKLFKKVNLVPKASKLIGPKNFD